MATTTVSLPKDTWTAITTDECYFENTGATDILVSESADVASIAGWHIIRPFQCFVFEPPSGETLFAKSKGAIGAITYSTK